MKKVILGILGGILCLGAVGGVTAVVVNNRKTNEPGVVEPGDDGNKSEATVVEKDGIQIKTIAGLPTTFYIDESVDYRKYFQVYESGEKLYMANIGTYSILRDSDGAKLNSSERTAGAYTCIFTYEGLSAQVHFTYILHESVKAKETSFTYYVGDKLDSWTKYFDFTSTSTDGKVEHKPITNDMIDSTTVNMNQSGTYKLKCSYTKKLGGVIQGTTSDSVNIIVKNKETIDDKTLDANYNYETVASNYQLGTLKNLTYDFNDTVDFDKMLKLYNPDNVDETSHFVTLNSTNYQKYMEGTYTATFDLYLTTGETQKTIEFAVNKPENIAVNESSLSNFSADVLNTSMNESGNHVYATQVNGVSNKICVIGRQLRRPATNEGDIAMVYDSNSLEDRITLSYLISYANQMYRHGDYSKGAVFKGNIYIFDINAVYEYAVGYITAYNNGETIYQDNAITETEYARQISNKEKIERYRNTPEAERIEVSGFSTTDDILSVYDGTDVYVRSTFSFNVDKENEVKLRKANEYYSKEMYYQYLDEVLDPIFWN